MIFALAYLLVVLGVTIASISGLVPASSQLMVPDTLRFILFFVGTILSVFGMIIIHSRANKTGSVHLLEFGRPDRIIWFWVGRDDTVKITPAMKEVEGTNYSKELDALVSDIKSYRLFDHSVRFVPEGLGHTADLDMVLYCTILKTKYGFANLREARKGKPTGKKLLSKEMISFNPEKDFEGYKWED